MYGGGSCLKPSGAAIISVFVFVSVFGFVFVFVFVLIFVFVFWVCICEWMKAAHPTWVYGGCWNDHISICHSFLVWGYRCVLINDWLLFHIQDIE